MEFCWDARSPVGTSTQPPSATRSKKNSSRTRSSLSLGTVEETFRYLRKYKVLICREHGTGIQNLNTHLLDHHAVASEERKRIVEHYQYWWIKKPRDIELPPPLGPPIKELGEPLDGLQCTAGSCDFTTINVDRLRKHCKAEHALLWKGDTSTLFRKVKVQTFFRHSGLQRYFVVKAAPNGASSTAARNVADVVGTRLAEWEVTTKAYEEQAQVMDAEAAKTDKTGWFKRTGWLEHLAKRNLAHLAYGIRLPGNNEPKLKQAAKVVELLVERSVTGLSTLARETRRWLKSAQQHEIDQRPLARLQNPESQARYAGYMVRFVCYFLRIIADEEARAERSGDDEESAEESSEEDSDVSGSSISSRRSRRHHGAGRKPDLMKDARELFLWQGRQKERAEELWDVLDGQDEAAQVEALLQVLASFIFEPTGDKPFRSGLIHFLAVLGIDAEMNRLRTAKNYSYMLAGVVYCVRVIGAEALLPAAHRDEQGDEDREQFLLKRRKFLADGSYSPMSEMISLLAYGKFVALNTGNSGSVYWSKDKKIFYLHGKPIAIRRFQQMAQDMVAEVEVMLWEELLWVARAEDRFVTKLERLVDDVTFTRRGVSFVNRPDNRLDGGLEWMLTRALQTEGGRKLGLGKGGWKMKQAKQYLRKVNRFLELLLVCVHMTSGQPGRGSEVTTMRHRNGVLQDRNIFVVDGQVMTVVRYHKSQSQWDKPKVVPRFLPRRLGQVMVTYLAYLQPFQEYLTVQVLGGGFSDYVWADEQGPWGTDRLTRALKRESGKRLGLELTTLDYRHTAVGIGRVVVGESFGRGYQDEVGEIEEAEVDEDGESPLELQNSRTTQVGVGNYSVPIDIIKHLSIRSIETFRPLSGLWHRFLGLADGEEVGEKRWEGRDSTRKRRRHNDRDKSIDAVLSPHRKQVRTLDNQRDELQKAMQQVLDREDVSFKSMEQERAMQAILNQQTPLVVVLPTGGGKSLLFTVPACLQDAGVTVVVVPYRALIEDLVKKIRDGGVDCMEWKHGQTDPAAVVVVSADVAGGSSFLCYAGMLSGKGLLRRVVLDECHLVFTSSDWRPKLAKLKNLRVLLCPIVLLTATLPPVLEEELGESMLVRCATYIRASTVRPNIRYFVSWCERGKSQETAAAMCRRQQQQLRSKRKGVVYCRSKAQCEALAEELDCAYYHAGLVDRAERLEEWLTEGGLIVATSALGTGVDFPGITFILHVGMPWSMIDFAQESGRGGRAGETVDSIIIVEQGEVEDRLAREEGSVDVQAMGMFIVGSGCRRGMMSGYLDGKRIECNDIESAGCDRCGEGVREWQDSQSEASSGWQQIQEVMDRLRDGCTVCWALGTADGVAANAWREHRTMQCSAHEGLTCRDLDGFRRGIVDRGGSHSCRRCWVSQKYCATGEDVRNQCQWPNIVVPLAMAAMGLVEGAKVVQACGYEEEGVEDSKEYARWLGRRHSKRVWGEYFSNAMVVAIRVIVFTQSWYVYRGEG